MVAGGRRVRTTQYRPDPWKRPEWLVAASGILVAVGMFVIGRVDPADLNPSLQPLRWPELPAFSAIVVLIGALPAWLAPRPPTAAPPPPDRFAVPVPAAEQRTPETVVVITFEHVTFSHAGNETPVLRDVELAVDEGELCLVIGRTGAGKSTLLGATNGLVPHFTGGHLAGRVVVDGRDTREFLPRDLAGVVGVCRPGSARRLRDRHGGGGARLRDGATGNRRRCDAEAGRGDARPPGDRGTAGSPAARRSPAGNNSASPSARSSLRIRARSCWTNPPRRSTPPPPKTCSRRSPASCTTSV